jgi:hypothetical protein
MYDNVYGSKKFVACGGLSSTAPPTIPLSVAVCEAYIYVYIYKYIEHYIYYLYTYHCIYSLCRAESHRYAYRPIYIACMHPQLDRRGSNSIIVRGRVDEVNYIDKYSGSNSK